MGRIWTEFGIDYAMPNTTKKQDTYGGLYDAENGVMLTGEISQDMLGGYNKTVLQYANKGLAQNMVSQGAAGMTCGTTSMTPPATALSIPV